jgi:hypothetical protein
MPSNWRQRRNQKKTYTLSVTQEIHEQIRNLAIDAGTTQQEIATILLNTALGSLHTNLKQEIIRRRVSEAQDRLDWLHGIQELAKDKFDPPIVPIKVRDTVKVA